MKYFEFIVTLVLWGIAIFWFKNSIGDDFPYEPAGLIGGGLLSIVDSLRRFGIFSKVCLLPQNPVMRPWSFSGGKVNKTDVRVELIVENNKEYNVIIRSIEIHSPVSVVSAVGRQQNKARIVDMEKIGNDASLPMSISGKSSKTLLVESVYDASDIDKYIQASNIGKLKKFESFDICVTYTIGSSQKITPLYFAVETSNLFEVVRSKYEESGDYKGVVKLIEKT